LPSQWVRDHHHITKSGWEKVLTKGEELEAFRGKEGFNLIATELGIDYPK
jgi:hypothetical protein